MKTRLTVGAAILTAAALILSGCALNIGSSGLAESCRSAIEDASREFVSLLEDAANDTGSSNTAGIERLIDDAQKDCDAENSSEAASALLASIGRRAADVADSNAQGLIYFSLDLVCDQIRKEADFKPTDAARDACVTADVEGSDYLVSSGGSSSSSDDIFGSDGPAIGDVDTDLGTPTGSVPAYRSTYAVDGSGTAYVTYIDAEGDYQSGTVSLPWEYSGITTTDYLSVSATADQDGQISCAVYADGVELDKYSDSGSFATVYCSAFID